MKIVVSQKNLKRALGLIEPVVGKTAALPVLANVILKTESGRLKIAGTNLEIGITCFIGAKIDEAGEVAVPGRILSDFIQSVPEETITLTTKNNTLLITTKAYKTTILGSDPKEYPIIPKVKGEPVFHMAATVLKTLFTSVSDAIATSDSRPELAGLFLNVESGGVTCAATDSFRLAEHASKGKTQATTRVIIPRATVVEVLRLVGEGSSDVSVVTGENQIAFTTEDCQIVSRLIDGTYPDYKKVIPEKWVSKALVDSGELEKSIRLAGLFSSAIADITLSCQEGKMVIEAENSDRGQLSATSDATLKNDPFSVTLNFHYLLDGIRALGTEKAVIEFTGQGSPLIVRPADDKKEFTYLIMPLRR